MTIVDVNMTISQKCLTILLRFMIIVQLKKKINQQEKSRAHTDENIFTIIIYIFIIYSPSTAGENTSKT